MHQTHLPLTNSIIHHSASFLNTITVTLINRERIQFQFLYLNRTCKPYVLFLVNPLPISHYISFLIISCVIPNRIIPHSPSYKCTIIQRQIIPYFIERLSPFHTCSSIVSIFSKATIVSFFLNSAHFIIKTWPKQVCTCMWY